MSVTIASMTMQKKIPFLLVFIVARITKIGKLKRRMNGQNLQAEKNNRISK
jgi:hypothetical protein